MSETRTGDAPWARLDPSDTTEIMATAHALADAARGAILPYFRQAGLQADTKETERFDPVTEADRASEQAMRDVLAARRPDDGILGEEQAAKPGTSGLRWVLDPIDGTRGFISGTPTWGVLIAVEDRTGPVYGIIDQPYIGERFEGGLGVAQLVGPQGKGPLAVSATTRLADAVLFTTFPEVGTKQERAGFEAVRDRVKLVRYGMDCYAYALLAAGQIDLVIEAGLATYDIAAPIAVIEAAGGIVTDWQGQPAHGGGRVLAAATPELHAAALALLAEQVSA
jgi:histidinol phosphatase-like enzyme (inositol monophosphatase family)